MKMRNTNYIIAGLGNPGEEYERTRHNTGRIVLDAFRKAAGLPEWTFDKKVNALVSTGVVSESQVKGRIVLVLPETFMNKSGDTLRGLVKSKKAAEWLVVIHDDLDIPFGSFKLSFDKSSGGHRGVESVIRSLGTQAFGRVRVGIAPIGPKGALKKPKGETAVLRHILGQFSPAESAKLAKLAGKINKGLFVYSTESREKAMSQYNG